MVVFTTELTLTECQLFNIKHPTLSFLRTTESEVVTGKSQTEALPYGPSDSEVDTVGRGLTFSRNDRTVEVIKLFIYMAPTTNIRIFLNYSLLCFCKPVIGPWALRENNALQFIEN